MVLMTEGLKYWNVGSIFASLFSVSLPSSFQLFFYANVYTKFKAIYMRCQSPAFGPRL